MAAAEGFLEDLGQLIISMITSMISDIPAWVVPLVGLGVFLMFGTNKIERGDVIAIAVAALGLAATLYQIKDDDDQRHSAFAERISGVAFDVEGESEIKVRNANMVDAQVIILIQASSGDDHPNLSVWIPSCSELTVRAATIPGRWMLLVERGSDQWVTGANAHKASFDVFRDFGKADGYWTYRLWTRDATGTIAPASNCGG
ncbi:hypothetical protein GCM10023259_098070 [Thermocatellispora tengchongensis]